MFEQDNGFFFVLFYLHAFIFFQRNCVMPLSFRLRSHWPCYPRFLLQIPLPIHGAATNATPTDLPNPADKRATTTETAKDRNETTTAAAAAANAIIPTTPPRKKRRRKRSSERKRHPRTAAAAATEREAAAVAMAVALKTDADATVQVALRTNRPSHPAEDSATKKKK